MTGGINGHMIRRLDTVSARDVAQLADVLIDCVEGGASVSFMHPLERRKAEEFWRGVADDVATGRVVLLAAEDEHGIVGTAHLVLAQPENQPHRADVAKMLVHRRGRRRRLGLALMQAIEREARAAGKTVLMLDTVTGDAGEQLYRRAGWIFVGAIPDYALLPQGGLCGTSVFYRKLD